MGRALKASYQLWSPIPLILFLSSSFLFFPFFLSFFVCCINQTYTPPFFSPVQLSLCELNTIVNTPDASSSCSYERTSPLFSSRSVAARSRSCRSRLAIVAHASSMILQSIASHPIYPRFGRFKRRRRREARGKWTVGSWTMRGV